MKPRQPICDLSATSRRARRAAAQACRRRLAFQALEDRRLFSVVVANPSAGWQVGDDEEAIPAICVEFQDQVGAMTDGMGIVNHDTDQENGQVEIRNDLSAGNAMLLVRENAVNFDQSGCGGNEFEATTNSQGTFDIDSGPVDTSSAEGAVGQLQPHAGASSLAAAVEQTSPSSMTRTAADSVRDKISGQIAPMSIAASARPRMLDIGRAVDLRSHRRGDRTAANSAENSVIDAPSMSGSNPPPVPDSGPRRQPQPDRYFQTFGDLPRREAHVHHAAARDEFNSFVLGRFRTSPPAVSIDTASDPRAQVELAADDGDGRDGASPATPAPFRDEPIDIPMAWLEETSLTPSLLSNPLAVAAAPATRGLPLELALAPEIGTAGPTVNSRCVADAAVWPLFGIRPGRLVRTACLVGLTAGLVIIRRKSSSAHPDPPSAPPASGSANRGPRIPSRRLA